MFILIFWISSFLFILYLFKEIISPKKSIPMFKKISNDFFYSFVIFAFLLFFLIIIISINQLFIPFSKFIYNVIIILYIIFFSLILILLFYFFISYFFNNSLFIFLYDIICKDKIK